MRGSQQTVAVLDELISKAGEFELAAPPPALIRCREKLREDSYKVLVVGEAKRGKSTFVNALIGRDVLPTDVDVATSQVFNIRFSDEEACRLRFEDGSSQELALSEISRYGSQVAIDAGIVPSPQEIIRWIEVEVPAKFLPKGISILDTPGLGALYAGHARITHRFVPEADAVIFVLESSQPVIEDDLKFIEQILTITPNIFFIQTKIDQYAKEDWQSIQLRNQEILAEKFKGRLRDTRVWPISSTNLKNAASADEKVQDVYLMVSRYKALTAALEGFLARVSAQGRTADAVAVAVGYHAAGRRVLAGRLAGLTAESRQQQSELQAIAVEGKRRFDAEWGIQGQKYRDLREGLQRVIAVGKQSFANAMQPGSDIEAAQKEKIEKVTKLKQANRVAEEMPGEIITAAMNEWARICDEVQRRCVVLLGPFADAVDELGTPVNASDAEFLPRIGDPGEKFKNDYFMALRSAAGGGMLVLGVSGMASLVAPAAAAAVLASSVMPFVAVPLLAALLGGGVKGALSGQVSASQQQLRVRLAEQFQKVRRYFFDVDLTTGRFSRVDEYFRELDLTVNEYVRALVEKKSKESQAEISRLKEASLLGNDERDARAEEARVRLEAWDALGKSLGNTAGRVRTAGTLAASSAVG